MHWTATRVELDKQPLVGSAAERVNAAFFITNPIPPRILASLLRSWIRQYTTKCLKFFDGAPDWTCSKVACRLIKSTKTEKREVYIFGQTVE